MNASPAPSENSARGRFAVVSGLANNPMAPRGQRTQNVAEELGKRWELEFVALPPETFERGSAPVARQPLPRRVLGSLMRSVALDRWEPWAARRLRHWDPDVDAALLVGYPWSPVTRAAKKLARNGIPYVVDAGDPWVLTEPAELSRSVSVWRARRAELPIWENAVGAVVTTRQQADRLQQAFPHLRVLARPNGYVPTPVPAGQRSDSPRDPSSLTLAHFGTLSPIRVEIAPLLAALKDTGRWRKITFVQFGDDYAGKLQRVPDGVRVERHPSQPWAEIVARAADFDAAVVLGNQRGYLLPSKAVQYLTLPIPRIAVTNGEPDDSLATFAAAHSGWMVAGEGDPAAGEQIWEHLERGWSEADLAPPEEESWSNVAVQVAAFIEDCVNGDAPAEATEPSLAGGTG